MRIILKHELVLPFVAVLALLSGAVSADQTLDAAATDSEIRVGNVMPYTGPLAAFSTIGRTEAAYFDMINERGGINGRKVRFISYDDNSDPAAALEQTRKLVETDKVLLMFGSFGTPGNLAARPYLNEQQDPAALRRLRRRGVEQSQGVSLDHGLAAGVPRRGADLCQLHPGVLSGAQDRGALAERPVRPRPVPADCRKGSATWARMIVYDIAFEMSDKSINTQIDLLKDSGAEILLFDGAPAVAALAIRRMAELDWHPVFLLDNTSASIADALRPAGLENSIGRDLDRIPQGCRAIPPGRTIPA